MMEEREAAMLVRNATATIKALTAERDRYRKALERISRQDVNANRPETRAWDYEQVAREALADPNGDSRP